MLKVLVLKHNKVLNLEKGIYGIKRFKVANVAAKKNFWSSSTILIFFSAILLLCHRSQIHKTAFDSYLFEFFAYHRLWGKLQVIKSIMSKKFEKVLTKVYFVRL